jgi:hypothetical protein
MNDKRTASVTLRFTAEEIEQCETLLARIGVPSLRLSVLLHDRIMAMVAQEVAKPSAKKGAGK